MGHLASLRADKCAEIFIMAVSERFQQTPNLKVIFACFLVTPVRKEYSGTVTRPGLCAVSTEAMWNQAVAAFAMAFSSDMAQMANLFRNYLHNMGQFGSVKDLWPNQPRCVSITGWELDAGPFC
jgi:hypothetical protein